MMSLVEIRGLAAAVEAAQRSGILTALSARALSCAELAAELGTDLDATARVVEVLETWQLVTREGERHRLAPRTRSELAGPEGMPTGTAPNWERTLEFLRRGSDASMLARRPRGEAYALVVDRLSRWFEPAAVLLVERLEVALGDRSAPRILDVGAGGGIWSLTLLERCRGARATALDLPPVVPVYEAAARARGLEGRIETLPGDFHTVALPPGGFDVVIVACVLHLETLDAARSLVARAAEALAPSGLFVVVDMLSDGSLDDERSRAIYALNLALRVPKGHPHREELLRGFLTSAALVDVERIRLSEEIRGLTALVARRKEG